MIIAIYELNGKKLKTTNLTTTLQKLKQEPTIYFSKNLKVQLKKQSQS